MPKNDLRNELLDRLSVLFNKGGGIIQDFNLLQKTNSIEQSGANHLIEEETSYDVNRFRDESETLISQLNVEQFDAFTMIIDSVVNSE
jgi:hypothetical protein